MNTAGSTNISIAATARSRASGCATSLKPVQLRPYWNPSAGDTPPLRSAAGRSTTYPAPIGRIVRRLSHGGCGSVGGNYRCCLRCPGACAWLRGQLLSYCVVSHRLALNANKLSVGNDVRYIREVYERDERGDGRAADLWGWGSQKISPRHGYCRYHGENMVSERCAGRSASRDGSNSVGRVRATECRNRPAFTRGRQCGGSSAARSGSCSSARAQSIACWAGRSGGRVTNGD
jgi:hypothetical protein